MTAARRTTVRGGNGRKGGAKLRKLPAGGSLEPYEFLHAGDVFELPSFGTLKSGLIRRIRNMDEADAFYTLLEACADERALAATDDMTMEELGSVMQGWQEHAQVTLSELRGSSS
jgi:hypothetical protein